MGVTAGAKKIGVMTKVERGRQMELRPAALMGAGARSGVGSGRFRHGIFDQLACFFIGLLTDFGFGLEG